MLMHAIAHAGCADTIRECALKVDFGKKIPAATGNRTCVSSMTVRYSNPLSYMASHPHMFDILQQEWQTIP